MMWVRGYATTAFWAALFPLLVVTGNILISLGSLPPLNIQNIPWLALPFKYMIGYALITIAVTLLSRMIDRKGMVHMVKWIGWPHDATDGVISFLAGTIVGISNVLLVVGLIFLQILIPHSLTVSALSGNIAVILVGPPEELARCYIQKKLAVSISRWRSGIVGSILSIAFITTAFGFAHEMSRLLSNLFTSGSVYLFSFQDVGWYIGGFILALLYIVMKNWFANSVAHSWYNLIISFFLY